MLFPSENCPFGGKQGRSGGIIEVEKRREVEIARCSSDNWRQVEEAVGNVDEQEAVGCELARVNLKRFAREQMNRTLSPLKASKTMMS